MKWIKAEHKDLVNMGSKHWRDAKTKTPISAGTAFAWVRDGRNEVEWLDETAGEQQPGEERYSLIKQVAECAFNSRNQIEGSKGFKAWWQEELKMNKRLRELPYQPPAGEQDELYALMDRYAYYVLTIPKKVSQLKQMLLPVKWIEAGMPFVFEPNSDKNAQESDTTEAK